MLRIAGNLLALGLVAACGDPLGGVPRLSEVDLAEAGAARALPDPDAADRSVVEAGQTVPRARRPRGGLLGFLRRSAERARATGPAPPVGGGAAVADRAAPEMREVGPGAILPFGAIARLCGVDARRLGREIARYPENGRGYRLIDTDPASTALRTFFLSGFDDGCARQFTAALAVFGAPQMHERLRYGLPAEVQPVSETDAAYERVKARVCNVAAGRPCGRRMDRLARDTVFVSVYDRFGSAPVWKNILLHDGEVVALDIASR